MIAALEIANAIKRAGERVSLWRNGALAGEFWASLQPRRAERQDISGPAGWGVVSRYALYAAAESPELCTGDEILLRDVRYHVTQSDDHYLAGELLYRRAYLTKGGEAV